MEKLKLKYEWNIHDIFGILLETNTLVDCTLAAEGQYLQAHRLVLAACSPYFQMLFSKETEKHPIVILKDVKFQELKVLLHFIYKGEVSITEHELETVLEVADSLKIKGLKKNKLSKTGPVNTVQIVPVSEDHTTSQDMSSGHLESTSVGNCSESHFPTVLPPYESPCSLFDPICETVFPPLVIPPPLSFSSHSILSDPKTSNNKLEIRTNCLNEMSIKTDQNIIHNKICSIEECRKSISDDTIRKDNVIGILPNPSVEKYCDLSNVTLSKQMKDPQQFKVGPVIQTKDLRMVGILSSTASTVKQNSEVEEYGNIIKNESPMSEEYPEKQNGNSSSSNTHWLESKSHIQSGVSTELNKPVSGFSKSNNIDGVRQLTYTTRENVLLKNEMKKKEEILNKVHLEPTNKSIEYPNSNHSVQDSSKTPVFSQSVSTETFQQPVESFIKPENLTDTKMEELRKEITDILNVADLTAILAKKVRQQVEEDLDVDLTDRKKEFDDFVLECLLEKQKKYRKTKDNLSKKNSKEDKGEDKKDEEKPILKRVGVKQHVKGAKKGSSGESDKGSDGDGSDKEYNAGQGTSKKSKSGAMKGKQATAEKTESDSDEDWAKPRKSIDSIKKRGEYAKRGFTATATATATASANSTAGSSGVSGYARAFTLSPQLAAVMGQDSMARHEVVRKVWEIIRERNLYDPNNKQFAICDDEMLMVFGVRRFRIFGMMKFLKCHFLDLQPCPVPILK